MKQVINQCLTVAVLTAGLQVNALAGPSPGEVDFAAFAGSGKGGKHVEINLGHNLMCLAAKFVEKEEPEAAKLLRSVQLVRVNVVGVNDKNRDETEKQVQALRKHLDQQKWERIVAAQEKNGEDVAIHLKTNGEESLQGLAITVLDGRKKEAVFVNIVGDIKPEQVAAVGQALNIEPLKSLGGAIKK